MIGELIRHFAEPDSLGLATGVALLAAYLLPVAIAAARGHRFTRMIGAINLVLGWTVIGWFAALFWAVNRDLRDQPLAEAAPPARRESPLPESPLGDPPQSQEPVWIDAEALSVAQYGAATRTCPYCAEAIKAEATVCRYCARDLAPAPEHALPAAKLDERGMRELYDLLQEMERDTSQAIQDANLQELLHRSDQPVTGSIGSDSTRTGSISTGSISTGSISTGASSPAPFHAGADRLETIKAERFRQDEISIDEIVNSRDAGITASGRQTSRIKKAS